FALKEPGELSEVVQSKFGYHIIQLIERREGRRKKYEEVRPEIIAALTADFERQVRESVLLGFRTQETTVNPDNLLGLRDRYLPGEEGDLRLRRVEGRPPPVDAAAERERVLKE